MRRHGRIRIPTKSRSLALACVGILALGACEQGEAPAGHTRAELAWARAALERNPNLEVVATDSDTGVFTVRDVRSGQVHAVKVDELAAVPIAALSAKRSVAPAPAEPGVPSASDAPDASAPVSDFDPDRSIAHATALAEDADVEPRSYTIQRSGSQVKVSGPGVSIVSAGGQGGATTARGEEGQRTSDPITCEGRRMVHLDNRRIFVDGDAITALNGCELHITNSRIVASGTGVVVRDATVHITNSYIEGASGSYDAGIGAKLYLRGSTFNGVMHRDAFAQIQEQGGSQWR
jgi:hypothetical protein